MTLRTHLIQFFKDNDSWFLGVDMQRREFKTSRGGYFTAESIVREIRRLVVEGRLVKNKAGRLVEFRYKPSKYEDLHTKMRLL